jgi:YidC/Oxa1 family membrane protein insertase
MMDTQRLVLWVIFSMSILFLWDSWQKYNGKPSMFFGTPAATQTKPLATGAGGSGQSLPGPAAANSAPGSVATAAPGAAPSDAAMTAAVAGRSITLANDVLRLSISTTGAVLEWAELLKHRATADVSKNLVLMENLAGKAYVAETGLIDKGQPNHLSPYTSEQNDVVMDAGQQSAALVLSAQGEGVRVTKTYTLTRGSYAISVNTMVENTGTQAVAPTLYMHIKRHGEAASQASFFAGPAVFTGPAVYTEADKFQKISFSDIDKEKAKFTKAADNGWVAMVQHYFVSAWVPAPKAQREFYVEKAASAGEYRVGIKSPLGSIAPGAKATSVNTLWVGPQDQDALVKIAPGLDLVVDYGFLTLLAKPMFYLLTWLHGLTGNWGWAIVLLTVIIKAIFFLPMASAYKSMAKMKQVTPKMTALREKYGDDKMKMNTAMMELYKTEKLNPLGGCLPILITIPVFLALYWVLLGSVEMRYAPWILWVKDLASPDHIYVLPIILGATMWAQFKLNPTPPDPMQARVLMVMQVVFAVMFLFFPAGLVLYYIVNNVLSIAQQWFIYRQLEKQGYSMR